MDCDEARRWWEAEYVNMPATEPRRFHILSGAIFPIYDKIMCASGIHSVKIARAMLVDSRALVGLNLSPSDIPNVKQRLGIGTPLGEASAAEILALVVGDAIIELDNGWRLEKARIAGDEVIELVLAGVPASRHNPITSPQITLPSASRPYRGRVARHNFMRAFVEQLLRCHGAIHEHWPHIQGALRCT